MKLIASKFDVKAVRELLTGENRFISELWEKLKLPINTSNDEDFLLERPSSQHSKNEEEFLKAHNKGTSRARSLQELHERLEALKGKKMGHEGKLQKKGLKNRLLKKMKKDAHKLKKTIKTESKYEPDDTKQKSQKPIYNSEGKMVFSKFDFSESGTKTIEENVKRKKVKDPQKILKKIEKQNSKLEEMERKGELEKASEMKANIAWSRALDKAEGVKVKDNPELLKKTIRNEMNKKQQSKKKWDQRIQGVKQRQDDRQKRRKDNLQSRKHKVKLNKLKKAAKKGRIIPGF